MPKNFEIPTRLTRRATVTKRENSTSGQDEYDVAFSSETPVKRFFGKEVLAHKASAIDMSHAVRGLPLLLNHDLGTVLGRINDFRLEDKKTRGVLVFDAEDEEARKWKGKVDRGIVTEVSLGYQVDPDNVSVDRGEEGGMETVTFNRWTPLEGSITPVGADPQVGFGRTFNLNDEDRSMDSNNPPASGQDNGGGTGDINVVQFRAEIDAARRGGATEATSIERRRISDINEQFAALNSEYRGNEMFSMLQQRCVDEGSTIEQTRTAILALINTDPQTGAQADAGAIARPPARDPQTRSITPGLDAMEKFQIGCQAALEFRMGIDVSDKVRKEMLSNPYSGLRMVEMGREYLRLLGVNAGSMMPPDVARESLKRTGIISHGTSDYTAILANIANKQLGTGYTQNAETWRPLVTIVNLPDYKEGSIPSLTSFTDLLEVKEHGEYKSGTMGEVAEPIKMRKFGRLYSISREAILNDDLNAFTRIPRMMGLAAARKVGDLYWNDIIIGNPVLTQNGQQLFSTNNNNYVPNTSGNPPSVGTFNAAFASMRTQTDPDNRATLNVTPAFVMCPAILEGTVEVLTTAMFQQQNPGAVSDEVMAREANNRFARLTPVVEPRLDADSQTAWYMAASPNSGIVDTVAIAFLNGQEAPFMEQQEGFQQDGVEYKIRLEATAAPIAYQGLYKNEGVTVAPP